MISPKNPPRAPKILLSLGLIVVSGVYAVWQNFSGGQQSVTTSTTPHSNQQPASSIQITPAQSYKAANDALVQTLVTIGKSTGSSTPAPTPTTTQTLAPVAPAMTPPMMNKPMMGMYADGSYTGTPADAYYGTVQVKVIVQGGKIADVQFLQYPSDRSTSRAINSQAMPLLTQEAIQAQSANVSGVSGATFTSQAFQQSLASAVVLAKN